MNPTTHSSGAELSDDDIWRFWWSRPEVPEGEDDSMEAEFVAAVRRVIAADRAARPATGVPAGWKVVPIEPTTPMIEAALKTIWNRRIYGTKGRTVGQMQREEWLAMLCAAPPSPNGEDIQSDAARSAGGEEQK